MFYTQYYCLPAAINIVSDMYVLPIVKRCKYRKYRCKCMRKLHVRHNAQFTSGRRLHQSRLESVDVWIEPVKGVPTKSVQHYCSVIISPPYINLMLTRTGKEEFCVLVLEQPWRKQSITLPGSCPCLSDWKWAFGHRVALYPFRKTFLTDEVNLNICLRGIGHRGILVEYHLVSSVAENSNL